MSQPTYLVQVAIPRPIHSTLSYLLPENSASSDTTLLDAANRWLGRRVAVPLGKQETAGIILQCSHYEPNTAPDTDTHAQPTFTLKTLTQVLDEVALVDAHLLALLEWAARYYHHPIGEVVFTALPLALRQAKPLGKRAQALLNSPTTVVIPTPTATGVTLTAEQQQCLATMQTWLQTAPPKPILLHGITGSGKTEIYLHLMTQVLAQNQQVLVIVPEIGLTPQLLARFTHFFTETAMVCLHSGLSDGERLKAWLKARSAQARIIIGTRSAIFTPAPQLGLIVVDEEHDASLKQQDSFRYHARDLAIKRAQMLGIPVILGTATPSLESLHNTQSSRFHYCRLNQRPGMARTPNVQLQDVRPFSGILQAGLTPPSLQAMRNTLLRGEQVMVFLNRRGFAPALYCQSCGWQAACPHCSVNMTWHARRNRLVCHHCGVEHPTPSICPQCHQTQLTTQGQGTERLELVLQNHFATYPMIRIDRDVTRRKGELEAKLATVRTNEPLVLVGTQMLAKGHDFPNLTLVIILDTDQSLHSTDYRALERLGQLLVQVAGRAGRADKAGQVILQTAQPEHPLLNYLLGQGYGAFATQLLTDRQRWAYPPFTYQALIRASSPHSMEKALDFLQQISPLIMAEQPTLTALQCLGPVPAPLEKRANRYRAQLLLTSRQRPVLHAALHRLQQHENRLAGRSTVHWSIDVDPIEFS